MNADQVKSYSKGDKIDGISVTGSDPNNVIEVFAYNKSCYQQQPIDPCIFNIKGVKFFLNPTRIYDFLISVSQSWFVKRFCEASAKKMGILEFIDKTGNR